MMGDMPTADISTADMPTISRDIRIAVVGCGKMGEAMLAGWISSDEPPADQLASENFTVVAPSSETRARVEERYGVRAIADVAELHQCDIIVLAVKPQVMPQVLESLVDMLRESSSLGESAPLVISIAAGLSTDFFEQALPNVRVVRVMPNMPLQVGMGASVAAAGKSASEADIHLVNSLFDALGTCSIVPEGQIDAVCAISGGGPAYVAYMIEALRDAGVELGLDASLAEQLALQTVGGTWHAMDQGGVSPETMRQSVCSPGGTTLAALAAMDSHDFKPMMTEAMRAAVRRAAELRGEG